MGIAEQLADDESAARLKDASQLAQRNVLVGHLAERGDRVGAVEGRVSVGKRLCVATRRRDASDPAFASAAHRVVEHLLLEVEDVERATGRQPLRDLGAVIARARADLEDPLAGPWVERLAQPGARDEG